MHLKKLRLLHDKFPIKDRYPFNLEILRKTREITFNHPVTFFIGENGSGKSTILRAIAEKCGIYIWTGMERTRHTFNPYENMLYTAIEVEWRNRMVAGSFFSSQTFQNFSQIIDEWAALDPGVLQYFGGKSRPTRR